MRDRTGGDPGDSPEEERTLLEESRHCEYLFTRGRGPDLAVCQQVGGSLLHHSPRSRIVMERAHS